MDVISLRSLNRSRSTHHTRTRILYRGPPFPTIISDAKCLIWHAVVRKRIKKHIRRYVYIYYTKLYNNKLKDPRSNKITLTWCYTKLWAEDVSRRAFILRTSGVHVWVYQLLLYYYYINTRELLLSRDNNRHETWRPECGVSLLLLLFFFSTVSIPILLNAASTV